MHGNTSHVNREIPGFLQAALPGMETGAQREVGRRSPLMHEPGKSDNRVVPEKVSNKASSGGRATASVRACSARIWVRACLKPCWRAVQFA
jgi:hypothetical protein